MGFGCLLYFLALKWNWARYPLVQRAHSTWFWFILDRVQVNQYCFLHMSPTVSHCDETKNRRRQVSESVLLTSSIISQHTASSGVLYNQDIAIVSDQRK